MSTSLQPDLSSIGAINPDSMVELFRNLALLNRQREFSDRVLLDSPNWLLLEEITTYHSRHNLCIESQIMNGEMIVCANTDPALKLKLKCDVDGFRIDNLSTSNLVLNFYVFAMIYCESLGRWLALIEKRKSCELFAEDSFRVWSPSHWVRRMESEGIHKYRHPKIDISLKMTIYKESSRKLGFPEMKSLSREQTLVDLKSMMEDGKHCDVALLVEGKQFSTCKAILAAQSSVFEAMFCHDSKVESQVSLSDVNAEVFEQFLNYLYTGKVSSQLPVETVIELFQFSELHSAAPLSQICTKFVVNHCLEVIDTDYLIISSKIAPTLWMEMFLDLALQFRHNEFPVCFPLDLIFDGSLEETLTHHSKFGHSLKSTFRNEKFGSVRESFRKFDFYEMESLSREQALLDLKLMFRDCKHCDVVFLVDGKQFCAHKAILTAQSSVFEAMFCHDSKVESKVSLSDVNAEVFELFLNYLYTGRLSCSMDSNIMELLEMAHKYFIEPLRQKCDHFLCPQLQITIDTVIEQLQFSERYSLGRSKQICLNFITDHCHEVIGHDSWKIASKIEPTLLMDVIGDFALKHQQYEFPQYFPLKLSSDDLLEETVTHHAKFNLSFESPIPIANSNLYSWNTCSYIVCADTNPALKFEIKWNGYNLWISCLSTTNIFVDLSVHATDKVVCKNNVLLNDRISKEFCKESIDTELWFDFYRVKTCNGIEISLKMAIYKESSRSRIPDLSELKSLSGLQTLVDLKLMFDSGKHCDVTFLVDGKQFCAPKAIFAAQSPVFEAMFGHDSNVEMFHRQISLSDVTGEVFEQFLNYLCSGQVFLQLTLETVFELLRLAEHHSAVQLTQICIKFIVDHCLEVIEKDNLKIIAQFMPKFMMEIVHQLAIKHQPYEFPDCVPLELPYHSLIEETMTHHAKFSLTLEASNSIEGSSKEYKLLCTDIIPALEFKFKCVFYENLYAYLYISYLSEANIIAYFSVTCLRYSKNLGERICLLNESFSKKLTRIKHSLWMGCVRLTNYKVVDISLKIHFYKESSRKFVFPEMKSLSRQQLLLDLKSMFEGGKHCDVALLVEGKQFSAHKSILVNRSIVFEVMFRYDMKEKMENRVEMHDVKIDVFEQFLLYLYTGKVDFRLLEKYSKDMFVLADMHFLPTLAQMCLRMFGQSLTPESVAEQFELADQVGLSEFKQICTDYMNKTN